MRAYPSLLPPPSHAGRRSTPSTPRCCKGVQGPSSGLKFHLCVRRSGVLGCRNENTASLPVKVNHEVNSREYLPFKSQPRTGHTRKPDPTHNELKHTTTRKTDPNSVGVCFDGCEVRRCDPCALVRPRVPCVSRVCPVSVRNHTQKALHTSVPVPVKRHRGEPGHFVTFGHRGRATHT